MNTDRPPPIGEHTRAAASLLAADEATVDPPRADTPAPQTSSAGDDPATQVRTLARERFAVRARRYDEHAEFPAEDFADLFQAGLNAPTVPRAFGGLGLGPQCGDPYGLWMMTKELAKADLSLARCWEGHTNSLVILDALGSDAQKKRWFRGVVERGELWVAWSGEPQSPAPGEKAAFGTTVTKVSGGYRIDGTKVFCTSAGGATWAILLVNTAGPGGARHATASADTLLLLGCALTGDPTITYDGSWWDPIGMRGTVSHLVRFDGTFVPDDHLIGPPGEYLHGGWQTRFIPHYAASFLGAAEAAYELALDYVAAQKKQADPYVQQHVGTMGINVETGHLWLQHVAALWRTDPQRAQLAGSRARHVMEALAEQTVKLCIRACGARSLNRPGALERIYRDLSFYVRHDNDDHNLAMIGKAILGQAYDSSFYKP
jgi:alkylation response protein AidB-like acyl-CoA dehydrogenase